MKNSFVRALVNVAVLVSCVSTVRSQVVEFKATLDAAQEVPATASPASGTAIMLYDVAANTFDLVVSLGHFSNPIANSHLHEGPPGVSGPVVTPLGAESAYSRDGNTVVATFRDVSYGGDKLKLLRGGAYYNVHSAQFPGGEIRGQLIPRPKRLVASLNVAQEQATAATTIASHALGAAVMVYDPAANRISLRMTMFNFLNTLANSHFHEAPPGSNGPVVTGLGGASVYTNGGGGFYTGSFDLPYTGDPVKLLTGGAYLNVHSNAYPAGEIRGQVQASSEVPGSRFINVAARGQVGGGNQVLIQGFSILGPEPLRVAITAKGPSLGSFGVTGTLADPVLAIYDSAGRAIATNNDLGLPGAGAEAANFPGMPSNPREAALVLVLPPGNYSAVVSGNDGGTGVALLEVTDLRVVGPAAVTAE